MFDPLATPFADDVPAAPSWPSTPHPNSPIPNLKRSPHPPSLASLSDTPTSPGPYGREPQIYGQPESGLISPTANTGTNGKKFEKAEPYLRARITMLDRNRRDILIRFDAQVSKRRQSVWRTTNTNGDMLHWSERRICRILRVPRIGTFHDRTRSSSNCTTPSSTTTPRQSCTPSHSLKHQRRQTKKMIDSSKSCFNAGLRVSAKTLSLCVMRRRGRSLRAISAINLCHDHPGRNPALVSAL